METPYGIRQREEEKWGEMHSKRRGGGERREKKRDQESDGQVLQVFLTITSTLDTQLKMAFLKIWLLDAANWAKIAYFKFMPENIFQDWKFS